MVDKVVDGETIQVPEIHEYTTYTVTYAGDSYFSDTVWQLTDDERSFATDYAYNLTLYADAFFATYQTPIAICDHERILVHRGFPLAGQPSLSEEARALLECDCADGKELPPLCLQHGSEAYAAAFIPIQPRHTTVGGILLGSCNLHTKDTLIGASQLLARMIETQLIS